MSPFWHFKDKKSMEEYPDFTKEKPLIKKKRGSKMTN
jgi:hypothetical protein